MIALRDSIAMREAITHSLPSPLGRIIEQRITTLAEYVEIELGELVHFIVVEPGDQLAELEAELGFSPLVNLVDGSHFGDPAFAPPFEWLQDHGGWFELVYILSERWSSFLTIRASSSTCTCCASNTLTEHIAEATSTHMETAIMNVCNFVHKLVRNFRFIVRCRVAMLNRANSMVTAIARSSQRRHKVASTSNPLPCAGPIALPIPTPRSLDLREDRR
jgi:hypothetical protein